MLAKRKYSNHGACTICGDEYSPCMCSFAYRYSKIKKNLVAKMATISF